MTRGEPLTPRILAILAQCPSEWVSRTQIAADLGHAYGFGPSSKRAIERLLDDGQVSERRVKSKAGPVAYEYQITESGLITHEWQVEEAKKHE